MRNFSIDLLKFICAVLVVFLHSDWKYRDVLLPLTRCAVPCFFMISGYLLYERESENIPKVKHSLKKILSITIYATFLFFIYKNLISLVTSGVFYFPQLYEMIHWVLFNECPFAFHLWYLYAYLYVLLIVWLFQKKSNLNLLFIISPILLVSDLLLGKYGMFFYRTELPVFYIRNFLFVGIPYFSIGCLINQFRKEVNYSKIVYLSGIVLFALTSYLERFIFSKFEFQVVREHYLSTTFLSVCLFLFFLKCNLEKENFFSRLGKSESLYLYLLHPIILVFCAVLTIKLGIYEVYFYITPIVCLILTAIVIRIFRKIKIIK